MRWIGKHPPLYIREGDEWKNELNGICYECDLNQRIWWQTGVDSVPFPKKTIILRDRNDKNVDGRAL